jgi:hypothetical protein
VRFSFKHMLGVNLNNNPISGKQINMLKRVINARSLTKDDLL